MARGHTITIGDLDSYREDISSVTREAVSSFRERARAAIRSHGDPAGWGSDEVAAVRDEVAELMDEIVPTYGDATQSIASEMFEGVLDAQEEHFAADLRADGARDALGQEFDDAFAVAAAPQ